mmetsp:Transcript_16845/g.41042  ORF Transcript_16845/g.41042 Transcript_16845/m.41042 type:complete len:85 (+) Transcript_16845:154-408(+)
MTSESEEELQRKRDKKNADQRDYRRRVKLEQARNADLEDRNSQLQARVKELEARVKELENIQSSGIEACLKILHPFTQKSNGRE